MSSDIQNNFDFKAPHWSGQCDCPHYPQLHSHNFVIGKDLKKLCQRCGTTMHPTSQVFGNAFNDNRTLFYNSYNCICGHINTEKLYDGLSIFPSEAVKYFNSRQSVTHK